MKQSVGTPVVIAIVVVVVLAIVFFGYKTMAGPSKIGPEEMRKHMQGTQGQHGKQ